MIHNRTASVLSLARTVRAGLDDASTDSRVATPTLILLLDTLVAIGTDVQTAPSSPPRTVAGQMSVMTMHGGRHGS